MASANIGHCWNLASLISDRNTLLSMSVGVLGNLIPESLTDFVCLGKEAMLSQLPGLILLLLYRFLFHETSALTEIVSATLQRLRLFGQLILKAVLTVKGQFSRSPGPHQTPLML